MQPLLRRQKTHCLVLLFTRAHDVPSRIRNISVSKLEFQDILGTQKLPVTRVWYKWNTVGIQKTLSFFFFGGGEGYEEEQGQKAALTQKTSHTQNSSSSKQQLHFSWKFHTQHLPLMNNPYMQLLIRSQDKKVAVHSLYSGCIASHLGKEASLSKPRPGQSSQQKDLQWPKLAGLVLSLCRVLLPLEQTTLTKAVYSKLTDYALKRRKSVQEIHYSKSGRGVIAFNQAAGTS